MTAETVFVTFEPKDGTYQASMSIEGLLSMEGDQERVIAKAVKAYQKNVKRLQGLMSSIDAKREARERVPARAVWSVGDAVFKLTHDLRILSLELDDLYSHLGRDLGVKRKWLEKAIILRRYVPERKRIPRGLNWGRIEKGTRRSAERIAQGLPL